MPSPILARADALMQRRRQGEAGALDDVPILTDTVETDEALPVLQTEVAPPSAPAATAPAATAPEGNEQQLIEAISLRIMERITAELPDLIDDAIREVLSEQNKG